LLLFSRIFILFILSYGFSFGQNDSIPLQVSLSTVNEKCSKGEASIKVNGGKLPYNINWSNGKSNTNSIREIEAGDYNVIVSDSTGKDTTLYFKIIKEDCPVFLSNHFTPNGDNYNDTWQIANIQNYPEFELFVYNKWGQQVHFQKNNYVPWDGDWNGVKVPDGTYYYVFFYKASDKDNFLKGDVSILR
jgi:gliding motility-associated-like protein